MIVTLTEFEDGVWKLPNAMATPNGADNTNLIQTYIDIYERELLIKGLGADLYKILTDNYTGNDLNTNAPQRIKDLVNGLNYTQEEKPVNWEGLKNLISYYVYYEFLRGNQDYFSTFGVERPDGVNSTAVSANMRGVHYYREFYKRYQKGNEINRSLNQYLKDKESVYPEAHFTSVGSANRFGI